MLVCVANPKSQSGTISRFYPRVKACIDAVGSSYRFLDLTSDGFEEELQEVITEGGVTSIMGMGGDGTHYSVINTLIRLRKSEDLTLPPYAFCPLGTGNDIAKSLGLRYGHRRLPEVIDTAINGECMAMDLGTYDEAVFADMLSLGMDGSVLGRREQMAAALRKRPLLNRAMHGYVVYAIATISASISPKRWSATIKIDGADWYRGPLCCLLINNGSVHAGEFKLTPGARVNDGKLDVLIIPSFPKYVIHYILGWRFLPRAIRHYQSSRLTQAKTIDIQLKPDARLQVDGELFDKRERMSVGIMPGALNIRAPKA